MLNLAPPLYGEHQLDQLYSEVDPSGYRTPGAALSGAATPYTHSRNISSENLTSLDGIASAPGHVSASALQNRLQDLRVSDRNVSSAAYRDERDQPASGSLSRRPSDGLTNGDYFGHSPSNGESGSGRSSTPGSMNGSRRASNEDTAQASGSLTPLFHFSHYEDLAKVPSYSTAIKTPVPRSPGSGIELPTYGATVAESRPPIPIAPPSAHVRDSIQHQTQMNGSYPPHNSQRYTTASRSPPSFHEDERRLRLTQLRRRS